MALVLKTSEGASPPWVQIPPSPLPDITMKINLWYAQGMRKWRWTLTDDKDPMRQESGQQVFLRDAMNDVANTVEYILECQQND